MAPKAFPPEVKVGQGVDASDVVGVFVVGSQVVPDLNQRYTMMFDTRQFIKKCVQFNYIP